MTGSAQCNQYDPNYFDCVKFQAIQAYDLAVEEAAKSKAREAIAVAENLIAVGLVQTNTQAQIQTLDMKILQADLEKSQAAKYEQDRSRQALEQAQQKLNMAAQELNTALNIAAATAQIPNLGATYEAQRSAAEYTAQAVQHAQLAAQQYAYATGQATSTDPSLPTWYMDYDGDGWHSVSQQKDRPPGAFGWKSTTNGIDCDDKDSEKTYNCSDALPIKGWFLDNDRDGYFAELQIGTTKPTTPGNWTDVMTKGEDCNDNLFSEDNSVCVATPTGCTNKTVCSAGCSLVNCECVQDPLPDPCTPASIAAGVATTNLFKNSAVSTTMSQMPILFPSNEPPYSQQLEHGFNIKSVNGIISTTPIREGTANGLPAADYTLSVIADLHDHPAPGAFAPSAQDLFVLDAKRDAMSGFTTSYVSSSDGNIYALYIDDPNKLNAFVNNNPGFVGSDNNFKFGTAVGDYWLDVNHDLQRQGYTPQEAYTRATTLILKDAGVSLLKTDAKTIDFKKIDIEVVGDDINGNTIIIINDCK